jgi:hypothetical protein
VPVVAVLNIQGCVYIAAGLMVLLLLRPARSTPATEEPNLIADNI